MIVFEEMGRVWSTAFILICFGLCSAWAANEKRYFQVGERIELKPPPGTSAITRILWKHNGNMVAEWATGDVAVEYYGGFKGRADLVPSTGVLHMSPTTESDAGQYALEINDKLLDDGYEFILIQEVPTPDVWVRPGKTDDERILNCKGDVTKAGPVNFFWDINERETSWVEFGVNVTLRNNGTTQGIENFSCKMVNPAGEKISEPRDNPFYVKPNPGAYVALGLVPIVIVIVVAIIKRDYIKKKLCPGGGGRGGEGQPAGNGGVAPAEVPLKEGNQE